MSVPSPRPDIYVPSETPTSRRESLSARPKKSTVAGVYPTNGDGKIAAALIMGEPVFSLYAVSAVANLYGSPTVGAVPIDTSFGSTLNPVGVEPLFSWPLAFRQSFKLEYVFPL